MNNLSNQKKQDAGKWVIFAALFTVFVAMIGVNFSDLQMGYEAALKKGGKVAKKGNNPILQSVKTKESDKHRLLSKLMGDKVENLRKNIDKLEGYAKKAVLMYALINEYQETGKGPQLMGKSFVNLANSTKIITDETAGIYNEVNVFKRDEAGNILKEPTLKLLIPDEEGILKEQEFGTKVAGTDPLGQLPKDSAYLSMAATDMEAKRQLVYETFKGEEGAYNYMVAAYDALRAILVEFKWYYDEYQKIAKANDIDTEVEYPILTAFVKDIGNVQTEIKKKTTDLQGQIDSGVVIIPVYKDFPLSEDEAKQELQNYQEVLDAIIKTKLASDNPNEPETKPTVQDLKLENLLSGELSLDALNKTWDSETMQALIVEIEDLKKDIQAMKDYMETPDMIAKKELSSKYIKSEALIMAENLEAFLLAMWKVNLPLIVEVYQSGVAEVVLPIAVSIEPHVKGAIGLNFLKMAMSTQNVIPNRADLCATYENMYQQSDTGEYFCQKNCKEGEKLYIDPKDANKYVCMETCSDSSQALYLNENGDTYCASACQEGYQLYTNGNEEIVCAPSECTIGLIKCTNPDGTINCRLKSLCANKTDTVLTDVNLTAVKPLTIKEARVSVNLKKLLELGGINIFTLSLEEINKILMANFDAIVTVDKNAGFYDFFRLTESLGAKVDKEKAAALLYEMIKKLTQETVQLTQETVDNAKSAVNEKITTKVSADNQQKINDKKTSIQEDLKDLPTIVRNLHCLLNPKDEKICSDIEELSEKYDTENLLDKTLKIVDFYDYLTTFASKVTVTAEELINLEEGAEITVIIGNEEVTKKEMPIIRIIQALDSSYQAKVKKQIETKATLTINEMRNRMANIWGRVGYLMGVGNMQMSYLVQNMPPIWKDGARVSAQTTMDELISLINPDFIKFLETISLGYKLNQELGIMFDLGAIFDGYGNEKASIEDVATLPWGELSGQMVNMYSSYANMLILVFDYLKTEGTVFYIMNLLNQSMKEVAVTYLGTTARSIAAEKAVEFICTNYYDCPEQVYDWLSKFFSEEPAEEISTE